MPLSSRPIPETTTSPSLAGFPHLAETEQEFRTKLYQLGIELNINPDFIAGVMSFESKFDPGAVNPLSGASGLIQWMKSTAAKHGKTLENIRAMSRVEQLDLVRDYFKPWAGKLHAPEDAYLTVFYPCAIGKSSSWVVASLNPNPSQLCKGVTVAQNKKEYKQNKVFDSERKGYYTKGDVSKEFLAQYRQALRNPRIPVQGIESPALPEIYQEEKKSNDLSMWTKALIVLASTSVGYFATKHLVRAVEHGQRKLERRPKWT